MNNRLAQLLVNKLKPISLLNQINQRLQQTQSAFETQLSHHPDLDFDESNDYLTKNTVPFKYNELVICKSVQRNLGNQNKQKVRVKMIQLKPNEVFRSREMEVFHEHIIAKSAVQNTNDVTFNINSTSLSFSRPTLYEYVTLKEQAAVSSHYSIISLVPMLLEIGCHSKVLECGTGSGSMTLFLSERLNGSGLLHTFDIHSYKCEAARRHFYKWKSSYDLASNGDKWPSNVKFGVRNLCEQSFNKGFHDFYDAIYLDMANLDKAIINAYEVLKLNGVIVMNGLHLTQFIRVLNVIRDKKLGLETEIIMEPTNRLWEIRKVLTGMKRKNELVDVVMDSKATEKEESGQLDWTCRLEDRYDEKFKRGGLFFNYWSGFLLKLRKIR